MEEDEFYDIEANPELTEIEDFESDLFYVESEGFHSGPINSDQLIHDLNSQNLKAKIKLWTPGLKKWVSLFAFPELIKRWGLSRRKHQRVPLQSQIHIQDPSGAVFKAETATLSAGGLGAVNFKGVVGAEYTIVIHSPALTSGARPIPVKVKCVHAQSTGSGFEFLRMKKASYSLIQNYIQYFS